MAKRVVDWHIDFIGGIFYFLCDVLDGCSRAVLAWDIRPTMREADAEIVVQKAREAHPEARPRVISDQGSQFKTREFKAFITLWQASHVMTSPYYPQSNGKLERFHKTLKEQAVHRKTPLTLQDAKRIVGEFINYYNDTRLATKSSKPPAKLVNSNAKSITQANNKPSWL